MKNGPSLVIQGTIIGSLLMIIFGWLLAGRDSLSPQPEVAYAAAPAEVQQPNDQPEICQVSSAYPQAILHWCELITTHALEAGLPPDLVAAVMLMESGGDASAYSASGAVGLMQIMPRDGLAAEFECINGPCFASRPTIQELLDPAFNIDFGTQMLAGLISRLGSARQALKSYGPMDVGYSYADRVLEIYARYR